MDLDAYTGQRVTIYGNLVPGYEYGQVEGAPPLVDVTWVPRCLSSSSVGPHEHSGRLCGDTILRWDVLSPLASPPKLPGRFHVDGMLVGVEVTPFGHQKGGSGADSWSGSPIL